MRCGPSCLWRGVCPRDIAMIAIAALDCAFWRPRRLQPTTLPVAALWMAAPYHPVTNAARRFLLARSLPRLARRPILPPVTTRFAPNALGSRPGSDRRQPRPPRPRAATTRADPRRSGHPVAPCSSPTIRTRPALSPPCPSLSDVLARQGLTSPTPARRTPPLTRCARPTDRTVRRESSGTHRRTTWTRRPSREPSNGASKSAPASAPSKTNYPPAAGRAIVQCVDEIDEMQRWLEGRE